MKNFVALFVVFVTALAAPNDFHIPVINNLGVPLEPAENVAARAAHAAAHNQVLANQGQIVQPSYDPNVHQVPFHAIQTPVAFPNVVPGGQPIDTPEVAAAKAAHFAAHAQVNSVNVPYQQQVINPVPFSIPQVPIHQDSSFDDGSYYEGKYDSNPVVPFQQNIGFSAPISVRQVTEDDGSYFPGKYDPIVQSIQSGQFIPSIPSQVRSTIDDGSYFPGKYDPIVQPIQSGQFIPSIPSQVRSTIDDGSYFPGKYDNINTGFSPVVSHVGVQDTPEVAAAKAAHFAALNQAGANVVHTPIQQTFGNSIVPQDTPEVAAAKAAHFAALSGTFGYSTTFNPQPVYQGIQAGINQGVPIDTPEVAAAKAAHFAAYSLAAQNIH